MFRKPLNQSTYYQASVPAALGLHFVTASRRVKTLNTLAAATGACLAVRDICVANMGSRGKAESLQVAAGY